MKINGDMPENAAKISPVKNFFGPFIPRYDELTLFVMSITCILIVLTHANALKVIEIDFSIIDPRAILCVMFFLSGFLLSMYHIFARKIKSEWERFLMLFFALILNVISGIVGGGRALESAEGYSGIFPLLNVVNGILLLFLLRTRVIDESSIIESKVPPSLVWLSTIVAIALFLLCQYVLKLYWTSTLSICVAHATNLNRPVITFFQRRLKFIFAIVAFSTVLSLACWIAESGSKISMAYAAKISTTNSSQGPLGLELNPVHLPDGVITAPYEQIVVMTGSGGTPPYSYFCEVSEPLSGIFAFPQVIDPTPGNGTCKIAGTPRKLALINVNFRVCDRDTCTDFSSSSLSFNIDPDPYIKAGFPVQTFQWEGVYHAGQALHALVGNIDENPSLEIIATGITDGPLYAWHSDGTLVEGWPTPDFFAVAYPVLGRFASQSIGYEVFSSFGYYYAHDDLAAFSGSGKILAGWPKRRDGDVNAPASTADVDDDGLDEVFISDLNGLHAFKVDGSELSGWPQEVAGRVAVFADLDGDGKVEIISALGTTVFAHHYDGTPVKGFPVSFSDYIAGVDTFPVVGDVDGDGVPEIIVPYLIGPGRTSGVLVISSDGILKRNIAASGTFSYSTAPALADLDGDCIPEIIFQTDKAVDVWRGDGSSFPGWPVTFESSLSNAAPVVGDVDGDQFPEIIVLAGPPGNLRIYNRYGVLQPNFYRDLPLGDGAVPAIADIDLSGHNAIIILGTKWIDEGPHDSVWVYDLGGQKHGPIEWGQFQGGPQHQGSYVCKKSVLLPIPTGRDFFNYPSTQAPVMSSNPSTTQPLAVRAIAGVENTLEFRIGLPGFQGPADIYLAYVLSASPEIINIANPDLSFQPFLLAEIAQGLLSGVIPAGIVPWKTNTIVRIDENLFENVPVSSLLSGTYTAYVAVAPTGRLDNYYLWSTQFIVP